MAASRPKKLKKKLKKRAASRRQKAKKYVFYLFILLKKNPGLSLPRLPSVLASTYMYIPVQYTFEICGNISLLELPSVVESTQFREICGIKSLPRLPSNSRENIVSQCFIILEK